MFQIEQTFFSFVGLKKKTFSFDIWVLETTQTKNGLRIDIALRKDKEKKRVFLRPLRSS